MKHLVQFVFNSEKFNLMICNNVHFTNNGMVILNNCILEDKIYYTTYFYDKKLNIIRFFSDCYFIAYRDIEEQIIVNREDISYIKNIDDSEIEDYITKINKETAKNEAESLEKESKREAELKLN